MRKIKNIALICCGLLVFCGFSKSAAAAGTASFSVASGTYTPGATFSVPIYENSPTDPVNVVQAELNYDPAQLQLLNVDTSQSSFSGNILAGGSNGSIKVYRYTFSPLVGSNQVATASFKALSDSTSSQLNFAPTSHIYSNGQDIWDKNTTGATYTFTPPAVSQQAPPITPASAQPKPAASQYQAMIRTPIHDDKVLATTANLPKKAPVALPSEDNSKNWWALIGLCTLTALGLLARLFNLHKKIRARSPLTFLFQALKKAV